MMGSHCGKNYPEVEAKLFRRDPVVCRPASEGGGLICLLKSSDNMAALKIRRWAAGGHLVKMAASSPRLIFSEIEFILETFKMSTGKAQAFIKPGEPGAVEETS